MIFGSADGARQAVRRFWHAGGTVTMVLDGPVAGLPDRLDTVRYATRPALNDTAGMLRLLGPAWLIVDVGLPRRYRDRITQLAAQLHVLMISEDPAPRRGEVTLVGGGPGRTSLLTLEAVDALRRADVVFCDRLAPTDDLGQLAAGAEVRDVGKSPYHHPVGQRAIEAEMIGRARRGESVVRLKGGDPFVFGRGGEEMLACVAAGIPVRVVPGVSSALSVPASVGIPVTHRDVSKAFTVISGHTPPEAYELEALIQLDATIVILMGIANLHQIMTGLDRAGLSPDTPAAVIERGFSERQRTAVTTAGELVAEMYRLDITSPAVIVLGKVVAMRAEMAATAQVVRELGPWFAASEARTS